MKEKEIVLGIDPGGNGTTGAVWATDWQRGKGGRWYPQKIEVWDLSLEGAMDDAADRSAWTIWCKLDDLSDAVENSLPWVAIEDATVWSRRRKDGSYSGGAADENLLSTIRQVGALEFAAQRVTSDVYRVLPVTYRARWLGGKPQGSADGAIDQALLHAYGGKEKAVGGERCKKCGGRGRLGRGRKWGAGDFQWIQENDLWYERCRTCRGDGASPRGPLYPLWKPRSLQHCRAALAVAVYVYNEEVVR